MSKLNKIKVILINPPLTMEEQAGNSSMEVVTNILPPLGIGYIAAVLEANGINVKILDCQPLNMDFNDLGKELKNKNIDVIGITATTLSLPSAVKTAFVIREFNPKSYIVIGGPHITAAPETTMANECFDAGVYGEGEETFLELIQKISDNQSITNVRGLYLRRDGKPYFTGHRPFIKEIDKLPFPTRHLFPSLSLYHPTPASCRSEPLATIMSSRGCPNKCTFCDRKIFGNTTRLRSIDNVLDEMEEVIYKHGAKEIKFFDDTFTLDKKRIFDLCKGIKNRGINIEWSCLTRVNAVTKELLIEMRRAGCWQVAFGLESGDQKILNNMKKGITLSMSRNAVKWARDAGLNIRAYFVIGTPSETIESIDKTIEFAKSIDVDVVNFYSFVPLPGTEIYADLVNNGGLRHEKYEHYNVMINSPDAEIPYVPPGISEEDLKKRISYAHKSFYFRPQYILRQLLRTRRIGDIKRYIFGFRAIIGLTS
jgi:radical SAM superfamily enzyme YgiQ (UPF0313 family)